jgi:hypothetical protein
MWDPTDPIHELRDERIPDDSDPPDTDPGERFLSGGLWTRLNDPTAWHEIPDADEPTSPVGDDG